MYVRPIGGLWRVYEVFGVRVRELVVVRVTIRVVERIHIGQVNRYMVSCHCAGMYGTYGIYGHMYGL